MERGSSTVRALTIIGSAIVLAAGGRVAVAQDAGCSRLTFDAINTETKVSPDYLTAEELAAFFEKMPLLPSALRANLDPAATFASWDVVPEGGDGRVTREEFDSRRQLVPGTRECGRVYGPPPDAAGDSAK